MTSRGGEGERGERTRQSKLITEKGIRKQKKRGATAELEAEIGI